MIRGMRDSRERAEQIVPAGNGSASSREKVIDAVVEDLRTLERAGSHLGNWGQLSGDSEAPKARVPNDPPSGEFLHRCVDVPCPSGKHQRSMLTYRSHSIAAMFCVPCQKGWTEPTTHPALRDLATDSPR